MDLSADIAFAAAVLSGVVPPRILKAARPLCLNLKSVSHGACLR